jgi:ankyrin repeat protein
MQMLQACRNTQAAPAGYRKAQEEDREGLWRLQVISDADRLYLQQAFSDVLNYGADDITSPIDPFTCRNPEGDTCLHIASIRGDARAVQILLDSGLDPNSRGDMGNTPLHYAVFRKHAAIIQILLARGASANLINEFGKTALDRQ